MREEEETMVKTLVTAAAPVNPSVYPASGERMEEGGRRKKKAAPPPPYSQLSEDE